MKVEIIKHLLSRHWTALLLAIFCSVIIVSPVLYFRTVPEYKGIDFFGADGEMSYIAQTSAVYKGNYTFGNVFTYEGQKEPYIKQPLPAFVTAILGKMLGLNAADATIAGKIVFSWITFLLVYILFYVLCRQRMVALVSAVFVLMAPATTALFDPGTWKGFLLEGVFPKNDPQFLHYGRAISPGVSNIFFFGYFAVLYVYWEHFAKRENLYVKLLPIGASIILGLSSYTYFFTQTLLFAMTGLLWLFYIFAKDWKKVRELTLIGIGGLLISIPYILNVFDTFSSPFYQDFAVRIGQRITHEFLIGKLWIGVFVIIAIFYRKVSVYTSFIFALIVGVFILSNQQVITGKMFPIPQHYHWYFFAPIAGFVFLYFLYDKILYKYSRFFVVTVFTFVLLTYFLSIGVLFQYWSYNKQKNVFLELQRYSSAISWLQNNTDTKDVIFSNEDFSNLVLVYTKANVYYNGVVGENLVPASRLKLSVYALMYLNGVRDVKKYFSDPRNKASFSNRIFGNYWRAHAGCYECYPKELENEFIVGYQEFQKKPLIENLQQYRLTYMVWDSKKDLNWMLNSFRLTPVYEDDDAKISIFSVEQ